MLAFLALSLVSVASLERGASGNVSGSVGAVQAHLARCSDGPCPSCATPTCDESVGGTAVHRRMCTLGDRGDNIPARQNQVERHVQVQVARQAEAPQQKTPQQKTHITCGKYVFWGRSGTFWEFGSDLPDRGSTRGRPPPVLDLIFAAWYVTWRPKQHLFVSASEFGFMAWIVLSQMFGAPLGCALFASFRLAWRVRGGPLLRRDRRFLFPCGGRTGRWRAARRCSLLAWAALEIFTKVWHRVVTSSSCSTMM